MSELLAYIDAGSGSLIIQAAIATAVAIPIMLRHHISRFVNRIRGRREVELEAPVDDRPAGD